MPRVLYGRMRGMHAVASAVAAFACATERRASSSAYSSPWHSLAVRLSAALAPEVAGLSGAAHPQPKGQRGKKQGAAARAARPPPPPREMRFCAVCGRGGGQGNEVARIAAPFGSGLESVQLLCCAAARGSGACLSSTGRTRVHSPPAGRRPGRSLRAGRREESPCQEAAHAGHGMQQTTANRAQ